MIETQSLSTELNIIILEMIFFMSYNNCLTLDPEHTSITC